MKIDFLPQSLPHTIPHPEWFVALAIAAGAILLFIQAKHMFDSLKADVERLAAVVVPALVAHVNSLHQQLVDAQAQNAVLQAKLSAAEAGLPDIETQLKTSVDALASLMPAE